MNGFPTRVFRKFYLPLSLVVVLGLALSYITEVEIIVHLSMMIILLTLILNVLLGIRDGGIRREENEAVVIHILKHFYKKIYKEDVPSMDKKEGS